MKTNAIKSAASIAATLLAACGAPSQPPSTNESPDGADADIVLASETTPCASTTNLTLEKLRPKLRALGGHPYELTYEDGRTTAATIKVLAYGEARCRAGRSSAGGTAPLGASVRIPTTVSIATEDGDFVGTLEGVVTFRASTFSHVETDGGTIVQTFAASADFSALRGTRKPSLEIPGHDEHSLELADEAPGDEAVHGESMAALVLFELAFAREPYSQEGTRLGRLRAK